jgi:hypothetical protein
MAHILSGRSKVVIPQFPIETAFHIRQLRESIANKVARIKAMDAHLKPVEHLVSIEHVWVNDEEMVLIRKEGNDEGVAIALSDLHSGAISLQSAVDLIL